MHACIYMTLPGWLLAARLSGCLLVSLVHASYSLCSHRSALLCGCVQVIKVDRITGDQEFKKNMVYLSFICETTRIVTEKIPTTKVSTCTSSAPVSKVSETFGGLIPEGFLDAPGSSSSFVPPFAHAIFKASVGSTHRTDHVLQAQNFSRGSASTDHGLQHQQQSLGRSSTSTGVEEGRFSTGSFTSDNSVDSRGLRKNMKMAPAAPRSSLELSQEFTADNDEVGDFGGNGEEKSNIDDPEEDPETVADRNFQRHLQSIMPAPQRRQQEPETKRMKPNASSSSSSSWSFLLGQGAKGAADITPEDEEEDTSKAFDNGRNKPAAGRVTRGAAKGGRGARGGRAR